MRTGGHVLLAVLSALAGTIGIAAAQGVDRPRLETNEAYVEDVTRDVTLDVGDPMAVFAFVLNSLPDRVKVYPTENYYYFAFIHGGVRYAGNIRIELGDGDKVAVHFAYFQDETEWRPDTPLTHVVLDAARGVAVEKIERLVYRLSYGGKSVVFALNDLSQVKPSAAALAPDEKFIGPIFDESAIRFFLVYNSKLKIFLYILDETVKVADELFPSRRTDRILIGKRTGFAYYRDHKLDRKILIGVFEGNSRVNNYFDGPFDQLPDNFVEVRPTVLVAVPRVFQRVFVGFQKSMAGKPAPLRWLVRRALAAARRRRAGRRLGIGARVALALAERLVFVRARARVGGRLQFAISGAAALGVEVAELIDGIGIAVYEGYGLTETSPIVAANFPGQRKLGSVGRPIPGVRVVIDRDAMPAGARQNDGGGGGEEDGADGEIVVYGPNVMRGYHDRPAESRAALTADGGLRTGDVGHLDGDGFLYVTGRIKEQYKLDNGRYVSPGPLEEQLKLSPLIANVLIHGHNRAHNVALVVAGAEVAGRPDAHARIRAEIDRLSSGWRSHERVQAFAVVDEDFTQANDMLTPSLKIKRRNIVRRYQPELEALYRPEGALGPK